MSDNPCDWPKAVCPRSYEGTIAYKVTDGQTELRHSNRTDHTMTVGGAVIPLVKTVRNFSVTYRMDYPSPPSGSLIAYQVLTGEIALSACVEDDGSRVNASAKFSDKCVIEKSTLHYLDQRYGVCLYRYQKDELDVSVDSAELASFRTTTPGDGTVHMVKIKTGDYSASSTVEWRLIIDGVIKTLNTSTVQIHPFGGLKGQDIRQILVFPQPPSLAMPMTEEIMNYGFYDYGNLPGGESELNMADGGYKDMFYPEWCRNLQEDPFWRAAADKRYNISWYHTELETYSNYEPPPPTVDPMPIGSFARHPVAGDAYQFLVGSTPYTSPELLELVNKQLPDKLKLTGAMLQYPISLA